MCFGRLHGVEILVFPAPPWAGYWWNEFLGCKSMASFCHVFHWFIFHIEVLSSKKEGTMCISSAICRWNLHQESHNWWGGNHLEKININYVGTSFRYPQMRNQWMSGMGSNLPIMSPSKCMDNKWNGTQKVVVKCGHFWYGNIALR